MSCARPRSSFPKMIWCCCSAKKKKQAVEDKKADKEGQVTLEAGLCLRSAYSPPHTQRSTFHLSITPLFLRKTVEHRIQ